MERKIRVEEFFVPLNDFGKKGCSKGLGGSRYACH